MSGRRGEEDEVATAAGCVCSTSTDRPGFPADDEEHGAPLPAGARPPVRARSLATLRLVR